VLSAWTLSAVFCTKNRKNETHCFYGGCGSVHRQKGGEART
jgi:hypothetical protein